MLPIFKRLFTILIAFGLQGQARGEGMTALGPEAPDTVQHWQAPEPGQANKLNAQAATPAKVRLGLRLTPFVKVVTRNRDGTSETHYVPGEPLRHTLRARLNQTNHFFVGDWHVETVPGTWIRKTRHYALKINLYRRYGAFGQLEENIGSVPLAGVLEAEDGSEGDNVFVLIGVARSRLRDKFSHPYLDVVAGFQPDGGQKTAVSVSTKIDKPAPPAVPPANYSGELMRGRF